MSLTLGLTGMDPDTESALRHAFTEASAELGGLWTLEPETDASFVVVDMDTLYGPMSWLRLHAAEKTVIGLTTAARTQADYRLERPFSTQTLVSVLSEIAQSLGQTVERPPVATTATVEVPSPQEPASEPVEVASLAAFADLADSIPSGNRDTAAPASAEVVEPAPMVEPVSSPVLDAPVPPAPVLEAPAQDSSVPDVPVLEASVPDVPAPAASAASAAPAAPIVPAAPEAPAAAVAPAAPTTLAGWLGSGQLKGRHRLRNGQVSVLLDSAAQVYFGPSALKPLTELFATQLDRDCFEPVDDAVWQQETVAQGSAQPLSRLVWFDGLLGGAGVLAAGYDPNDRFRLLKWPQTEREYPKHFRIATVMMKGPATLAEITEASGVAREDVNDFVNASLATGFAQPYREPEPEPEASKSGGLFGRLRGR